VRVAGLPCARGAVETRERGGHPEGEGGIWCGKAGEGEEKGTERERQCRQQSRRRPEYRLGQRRSDDYLPDTEQGRLQSHGELVLSDDLQGRRGGPVDQRGLFKITDPVVARSDVIAAHDHFARNLGVAALVGLPQRRTSESDQVEQGGDTRAQEQPTRTGPSDHDRSSVQGRGEAVNARDLKLF
jgi:hypothetical protein